MTGRSMRNIAVAMCAAAILGVLLSACGFLAAGQEAATGGMPERVLLAVAPPGSTATKTPFQPSPPTITPTPTPIPPLATAVPTQPAEPTKTKKATRTPTEMTNGESRSWSDYPGPVVWPDIEVPPPVGLLSQPAGQINIMLLGSDQRPYESGLRTDTMILLTLNPDEGTAHLTSFPRDLYVYIPGYTVQRMNTAFWYGGFDSLAMTMEYNFGVRPDYYVLINLWSFEEVIDSLGGIDVEIGKDLCDHRDSYGTYCVYAGTQHMHGETTLWYVRSRYSTNDLDRNRRQQEVLVGVFKTLISLNGLSRAGELYQIYQDNVTTDMSFEAMAELLPLAAKLTDFSRISSYYIGVGQVYDWINYSGAQVLMPIRDAILQVMKQALNSNP
jgi:LCP family protein required for cell wall assembly